MVPLVLNLIVKFYNDIFQIFDFNFTFFGGDRTHVANHSGADLLGL